MNIPKELVLMIEIMLENGRAVSQVDTTYMGHVKRKMRRIERLLYFREWAIVLRDRTGDPVYFEMIWRTFCRLRDLGVVVCSVGVENQRKTP